MNDAYLFDISAVIVYGESKLGVSQNFQELLGFFSTIFVVGILSMFGITCRFSAELLVAVLAILVSFVSLFDIVKC